MEKFEENLSSAIKHLQIADHMVYVTYPLVNEKKLLLKIFDEIYKSIISSINAILNYEYFYQKNDAQPHLKRCGLNGARFLDARKNFHSFFCTENCIKQFSCARESPHSKECGFQDSRHKRIRIYTDEKDNLEVFMKRCSKNYNISQNQIKKIIDIIELNKKHKLSAIEFTKNEKIVIMSDNLGIKTLDLREIKEYLLLAKELLIRIKSKINY